MSIGLRGGGPAPRAARPRRPALRVAMAGGLQLAYVRGQGSSRAQPRQIAERPRGGSRGGAARRRQGRWPRRCGAGPAVRSGGTRPRPSRWPGSTRRRSPTPSVDPDAADALVRDRQGTRRPLRAGHGRGRAAWSTRRPTTASVARPWTTRCRRPRRRMDAAAGARTAWQRRASAPTWPTADGIAGLAGPRDAAERARRHGRRQRQGAAARRSARGTWPGPRTSPGCSSSASRRRRSRPRTRAWVSSARAWTGRAW